MNIIVVTLHDGEYIVKEGTKIVFGFGSINIHFFNDSDVRISIPVKNLSHITFG